MCREHEDVLWNNMRGHDGAVWKALHARITADYHHKKIGACLQKDCPIHRTRETKKNRQAIPVVMTLQHFSFQFCIMIFPENKFYLSVGTGVYVFVLANPPSWYVFNSKHLREKFWSLKFWSLARKFWPHSELAYLASCRTSIKWRDGLCPVPK